MPSLRESPVVDPPGVQTFAILTLQPLTVMGPLDPSPDLGTSSSMPPSRLTYEDVLPLLLLPRRVQVVVLLLCHPPIPREILYAGTWLCQYMVPKVPLPAEAMGFLVDIPYEEVYRFSLLLVNSLIYCIYNSFLYFYFFSSLLYGLEI